MKTMIVLLISLLVLSGCTFDSYFVRWWNGNISTKLSPEEEKISDLCYEETSHLPQNTHEERKKASLEYIKCSR